MALQDCVKVVSPVHAGIGPKGFPTGAIIKSFPRACGDRPSIAEQAFSYAEFPPCMRG